VGISLSLWSHRGAQLQQTKAAYAALSAQVVASRNHLAALSDEVVAARTRFAELAQALSANQKFMLDLARDQRTADNEHAPLPPVFVGNGPLADSDPVAAVADATARLGDVAASNRQLAQEVQAIRAHISSLDAARDSADSERDHFAEQWRLTQQRLAERQAVNETLAGRGPDLEGQLHSLRVAPFHGAGGGQAAGPSLRPPAESLESLVP